MHISSIIDQPSHNLKVSAWIKEKMDDANFLTLPFIEFYFTNHSKSIIKLSSEKII